jgi:hypothetical protein
MLFAQLLAMSGTAGLTLALIRRVRALFWAAVGAICAVMLPGSGRERRKPRRVMNPLEPKHTAVILAHSVPATSMLARVGELPVLRGDVPLYLATAWPARSYGRNLRLPLPSCFFRR